LQVSVTFHLVIPDQAGERILLIADGQGWALPRTPGTERTEVLDVGRMIHQHLGLDVVVLRSALTKGIDQIDGSVFLLTENLTDRDPTAGRWWHEDDLRALEIADPRERAAALAWFDTAREGGPVPLQPWQFNGWFATVSAWIHEVVPGVDEIAQYATWCNSCILRVQESGRTLYLKASPEYFLREADITSLLERFFPGEVPHVVALERSRGWMLLDDLGDALVSASSPDHWGRALDAIASLHRRSASLVDQLLEGGCLDRRPPVLATQIEGLAEDEVLDLPEGLRPRLRAAVGRLKEMCIDLDASPIPSTLVHGDLHADNIMRTERGYVLFDWTDACVATPFVDFLTFVHHLGPASNDPVVRRAFRDRYLDAWNDVVPHAEAIEWYERTEPLAAMHHAVTYRGIFDAFGPNEWWQFSSALPWWIEKALKSPILRADEP
jgi:hypothetical protein